MSVRTVATKDARSVSRSRGLWAAATVLALLFAVVAYGYEVYRLTPKQSVEQLFSTLAMVLAVLLPVVAVVASYLAIAGEREGGGIKFLLAFPNTRRDVFLGKLASRLAVVAAIVTFVFAAAASVALAKHGVLPLVPVVGLFALSLVYGSVFVGVALALSAAVASRSRAIAASVGAYFVLVILFVVPGVRITALVRWLHATMLGLAPNQDLYDAVTYVSPLVAFQKATNLVFPPEQQTRVFRRSAEETANMPAYLSDEFALVVFAAWLVVPPVIGYLRFDRSDLE